MTRLRLAPQSPHSPGFSAMCGTRISRLRADRATSGQSGDGCEPLNREEAAVRSFSLRKLLSAPAVMGCYGMVTLRRLRFAAAQIGAQPRGLDSRRMLLRPDDLLGKTWRVLDERTWRTGSAGQHSAWARRVRDAKSITAWRSFEQVGQQRWLWCEVVPLVSPEDAVAALSAVADMMLGNRHAEVRITGRRDGAAPPPLGSDHAWAREETTEGPLGVGTALYLAWPYHRVLNVIACSGGHDRWDWPQVQALGATQTARVAAVLNA